MCRACWEEHGSPTELPDNAAEVISLINDLYAHPDGGTGGPLHVLLDDFNVQDQFVKPYHRDDDDPALRDLADRIADLMLLMTEDQRAAVLAEREGWTQPPKQPERCPFYDHADSTPVPPTHVITGRDGFEVWACTPHAKQVVGYQASIGNHVTARPLTEPTPAT